MAAIKATEERPTDHTLRLTWSGVTENDTCAPYEGFAEYGDRSIHVYGTWGGASVAVKGSNADASASQFEPLTDPAQVVIAITSASTTHIKQITEFCHAIQPVTSGGSSQSLTIIISARRQKG